MSGPFPRLALVEQTFPRPRVASIEADLRASLESRGADLPSLKGLRIAVTAGSRGIARIHEIVRATVDLLKDRGADPFVVPAMGSHGGGTGEGQARILAGYGITAERMGVPIVARCDTVPLGQTPEGFPVFVNRAAAEADGIVPVNRVKPHTDFKGRIESGLMKMMTVGLGCVNGAQAFHRRTLTVPHERIIESVATHVIRNARVLFGVAVLENAYHEVAHLEVVPGPAIPTREPELLVRAKELMPSLPADPLDILLVERIGKEISGSGMDPNVTGRWFGLNWVRQETPKILRIVVLDLTDGTEGNAAGIGLADFTTARVAGKIDRVKTYLNAVTSGNVVTARLPLTFESDAEALEMALRSFEGLSRREETRLIRVRDTLSLSRLEVSEALLGELGANPRVRVLSDPRPPAFDATGALAPLEDG
jgi:hypothetical protein